MPEHTTDSVLACEYLERDSLVRELREVNSELALQKEMYQTLSRVSPVGIFRTDPEGLVEYINAKGLSFLGLRNKESLIGKDWTDRIYEEDKDSAAAKWALSVEEQNDFVVECRFKYNDGRITWVLCQANVVNGGGKGHVGTLTDITSQKEILTKLIALKEDNRIARCNGK